MRPHFIVPYFVSRTVLNTLGVTTPARSVPGLTIEDISNEGLWLPYLHYIALTCTLCP